MATIDHLQLQDHNDNVIAFFRPTRPQRYNIGEVHGELHFVRNAGAGVVVRAFLSRRISDLNRWIADRTGTDAPATHGHRNGYSDVVPLRGRVRTVNCTPRGSLSSPSRRDSSELVPSPAPLPS